MMTYWHVGDNNVVKLWMCFGVFNWWSDWKLHFVGLQKVVMSMSFSFTLWVYVVLITCKCGCLYVCLFLQVLWMSTKQFSVWAFPMSSSSNDSSKVRLWVQDALVYCVTYQSRNNICMGFTNKTSVWGINLEISANAVSNILGVRYRCDLSLILRVQDTQVDFAVYYSCAFSCFFFNFF